MLIETIPRLDVKEEGEKKDLEEAIEDEELQK